MCFLRFVFYFFFFSITAAAPMQVAISTALAESIAEHPPSLAAELSVPLCICVSSMGANGSLIEIITPPYLIVEHYQVVDENLAEFGRPLCNTRTISTLSGYIQCGEDDLSFSGTKSENEEINRNLKEGFFYE